MKQKLKLLTLIFLLMVFNSACNKSKNYKNEIEDKNSIENSSEENETNITEHQCEDIKILKVFNDEPAIVTSWGLNLINFKNYESEFSGTLVPMGGLSEQYMEEGLAVYISGNVTDCLVIGGTQTETRYAYFNLFELTSIKIITNIMEYPCKDMKILKVFNDEPATVKKESFHHFGMADEFYFELVNQDYEFLFSAFPGRVVPVEMPEQYMKEGLSVYISGNVTNCVVGGGTYYTRTKLAPIFFFELTSIKIRNLN